MNHITKPSNLHTRMTRMETQLHSISDIPQKHCYHLTMGLALALFLLVKFYSACNELLKDLTGTITLTRLNSTFDCLNRKKNVNFTPKYFRMINKIRKCFIVCMASFTDYIKYCVFLYIRPESVRTACTYIFYTHMSRLDLR